MFNINKLLIAGILLGFSFSLQAQVLITEIRSDTSGTVAIEFFNFGDDSQTIGDYWVANGNTASSVQDLTLICGSFLLPSQTSTVLIGFPGSSGSNGEMALYSDDQVNTRASLIQYVQWGSAAQFRTNDAVAVDLWTAGDFVESFGLGESIQYDGDGITAADWTFAPVPTICVDTCEVAGGTISTTQTDAICSGDGLSDLISFDITGNRGARFLWLVTNSDNEILGVVDEQPVDLEPYSGVSSLRVWHMRYDGEIFGQDLGNNALTDINGCVAFSNPINFTVTSVGVGTISTVDETQVCASDGRLNPIFVTATNVTSEMTSWVITDENRVITELPGQPPFDFNNSVEGTSFIYLLGVAEDDERLQVGVSIDSLTDGCAGISNPIEITTTAPPQAGTISTQANLDFCSGVEGTSILEVDRVIPDFGDFRWLIADGNQDIQYIQSGDNPDLSAVPRGFYIIRLVAFEEGIEGMEVGNNILLDLEGCFTLSNGLQVNRDSIFGGNIELITNFDGCIGDSTDLSEVDLVVTAAFGEVSTWVVRGSDGSFLEITDELPIDLQAFGDSIFTIQHMVHDSTVTGLAVGNTLDDLEGCFNLSLPVTISRDEAPSEIVDFDISTEASACLGDGLPENVIFFGVSDPAAFNAEFTTYLLTDLDSNIIAISQDTLYDIDELPVAEFLGWQIAYNSGLRNLEVGRNISQLNGCFSLSDPSMGEVGGAVSQAVLTLVSDSSYCASDSIADEIIVTRIGNAAGVHTWVITDDSSAVVAVPDSFPFLIPEDWAGSYAVWSLSTADALDSFDLGTNILDVLPACYVLSEPITIQVDTGAAGACMTSSITEVSEDGQLELTVYPVPAINELRVDAVWASTVQQAQIRVFDMMGRLRYTEQRTVRGQDWSSSLDVSAWEVGQYFIEIRAAGSHVGKTFVKVQ